MFFIFIFLFYHSYFFITSYRYIIDIFLIPNIKRMEYKLYIQYILYIILYFLVFLVQQILYIYIFSFKSFKLN